MATGCDTERVQVRPYDETTDRPWLEEQLSGGYGVGHLQARRGELIDVLAGEGLVAERDGRAVGVVLWRGDDDGATELTYLWAFEPGGGVGTALLDSMLEQVGLPIWVVTTNDNLDALRFYQRLGFRLHALRPEAVDRARRALKPSIPIEADGIPIRDELELVLDRRPAGR
jgi:ribosomal protein S18 acetylase RimI-like enzyme